MRGCILFLVVSFAFACATTKNNNSKTESLFNGKDLAGWTVPENNIWWKAESGMLSVENGPDRKGSILWTDKVYKNFVFETDFLMGKGVVDSGVFIRNDQQQIQIGISGSLKRDMTCSPYIPGKKYPVEATGVADLLKLKDWNTMRVEAVGNLYKVWLNGKFTMEYLSDNGIVEGPIGLQLHPKNEMSIDFKNISVTELP